MSQTETSQSEIKTCTPSFSKKLIAVAGSDGRFSKTYANRTQAEAMAAKMGSGWYVCQSGRPFFVVKLAA